MEELDLAKMSDQELLSLPEANVPAAKLDLFLARRTAIIEKNETDKNALTFQLGRDGRQGPDRAERDEREEQLKLRQYVTAMQDLRDREEELIDRIEIQHRETLQRLQDIDDRAIKLHDGRRAYVDGAEFRDKHGDLLQGADKQEAERLKTETSSKWAKQSEYERARELQVEALRDARKDRHKLDEAISTAADVTENERANDLKQAKALLANSEKRTEDLSQALNDDYASAPATTDSRRTASYAASLDGHKDGFSITPDFSDAAAGRSALPAQKRPEPERTFSAPSPSGP